MRGYVIRVMQLGASYEPPREVEVVTPKADLTDLIFKLGQLPERSGYWDVFYIEGDPIYPLGLKPNGVVLENDHVSLDGVKVKIKYVLTHGSLVFTDEGYTLYQRIGEEKDIPF